MPREWTPVDSACQPTRTLRNGSRVPLTVPLRKEPFAAIQSSICPSFSGVLLTTSLTLQVRTDGASEGGA